MVSSLRVQFDYASDVMNTFSIGPQKETTRAEWRVYEAKYELLCRSVSADANDEIRAYRINNWEGSLRQRKRCARLQLGRLARERVSFT